MLKTFDKNLENFSQKPSKSGTTFRDTRVKVETDIFSMGIIGSIRSLLSPARRREGGGASAAPRASSPRTGGAIPTVGNSWQALQVATVYRCVQVLGGSVAALPLKYMKKAPSGVFREDEGSRLSRLLAIEPDYAYNSFDFWDQAVRQILSPVDDGLHLELSHLGVHHTANLSDSSLIGLAGIIDGHRLAGGDGACPRGRPGL